MNSNLVILAISQVVSIILIAYFVSVIIKETKLIKFQKRLDDYSLTSSKDFEEPFFDGFYKGLWKTIKLFSKFLKKSEVISKYSKKFDKYITFDEKNKKDPMDFISIKFLISISVCILYIISSFLKITFDPYLLLLIFLCSFFIYDIYLKFQYKKRRKVIENDLLSAIIIMNNAFKSGLNIMQAVDIVKNELNGPIQDEFKRISVDIKYGLTLETVFERFYNRVKIEDIKYITSSLSLINKTGGNIVRVFNAIEKNFYDKKKIKDEMNSLTSSSIFMFRMLVFMPLILVLVIYTLNPAYFAPFFTEVLGRVMLGVIILLFIVYVYVIKKVLKVNV